MMATPLHSKQVRTLGWLTWLCALTIVLSWLGLRFLRASADTNAISVTSAEPTQRQNVEGHEIGDKVTFVFTITNPTANWLTVLPISATFDSTYIAWVSGMPTPTLAEAGVIQWGDLTDLIGDIAPGQDTPITVTFQTLSTTVHLPGGITNVSVLISDEKADPDGPGPQPGDISLPDLTYELPIAVNDIAGPPATPLGIERSPDGVTVAWQTTDESNILGFNLIRTYESGAQEQVNSTLIVAEYAGELNGTQYEVTDPGYKLLEAVTYEVEVEFIDGGTPTAVEMGLLPPVNIIVDPTSVDLTDQGVTPSWSVVDETYIQGFDLFRYDLASQSVGGASDPQMTQINSSTLLALSSGEPIGNAYNFPDPTTRIGGGGGYGYKLRVILRNGESLLVEIGTLGPVEIHVTGEISTVKESGITFQWLTFNELLITGFNLWRNDGTTPETKLNHTVVDAKQGGNVMGAQYDYFDWTADPYTSYVYTVEILLVDGSSIRYELPASTTFKRVYLPAVSR